MILKTITESVNSLNPSNNLKIFMVTIPVKLKHNIEKSKVLEYLKNNDIYEFGEEDVFQLLP